MALIGDDDLKIAEECWWEEGEYKCKFKWKDTKFIAGITKVDNKIEPGTLKIESGDGIPTEVHDKALAFLMSQIEG